MTRVEMAAEALKDSETFKKFTTVIIKNPSWSFMTESDFMVRRLLGAMAIGIRIEQYDGFRHIVFDLGADEMPDILYRKYSKAMGVSDEALEVSELEYDKYVIKESASVRGALDNLDEMLKSEGLPTLIGVYEAHYGQDSHATVWDPIQ